MHREAKLILVDLYLLMVDKSKAPLSSFSAATVVACCTSCKHGEIFGGWVSSPAADDQTSAFKEVPDVTDKFALTCFYFLQSVFWTHREE